jgi:tetratricopeptide (TPR) repeat protein
MKKLFTCLLFVLQVPVLFVTAQEAYKGQIYVARQRFSLVENQLQVEMDINYEALHLPSNESLTLIPMLRTPSYSLSLPSVLINGTEKHKVYNREMNMSEQKSRDFVSPSVVIRDDKKNARFFTYKVSVPYRDWMEESVLFLRVEECACNGKQAAVYEDKIANGITIPQGVAPRVAPGIDSRYLSLVNIITPGEERTKLYYLRGTFPFEISTDLKKNALKKQHYEIYYRLRDLISAVQSQAGNELSYVHVTGYGTPIGNHHANEREATVRALALKDYLREYRVSGKAPLEVNWISEDWDSIASLVKRTDMTFRDAILDVINTVDVTQGRERMLMQFADGVPYKYLRDRIFPQVPRANYEIAYTRVPMGLESSRNAFAAGSSSLTVTELFNVANSYPRGSTEYNDMLDLSARLFPDNAIANINAAAIALAKKDTQRARGYLERFAANPAAFNNLGILYMMEGNSEKAEVYLQMAVTNGVEEARRVLVQLKNGL